MDQTPPFQPAFNMEFFSSLHLPHGMGLGDSLDHPKAKGSFADLQSPLVNFKTNMHADHHHDSSFLDHNNFFLQQREDDMFHEPYAAFKVDSHLKNWQPPQNHGFLDVNLDPWFNKDKDFGLDPFQIRSRGGSFNFGRLRKDSEDFFHMNSDFFRQIRNITESKGPFENNFMKKPFQMQDAFEMPITDDAHAISTQIPQSIPTNYAGIPSHLQGTGMVVSAQNTDTTVDTAAEGSDGAKKKGRKKRILNDKTELVDEDSNSKPASKAGRPKKVKEGNDEEPKPQKAKKQSKAAKMGTFDMDGETCVKQEKDDKSTEISSSSASKIEDSPHGIKPNTDIMSEIMKIKAPENLKEILGGMNVPNEVKEFFQKTTNWMGQGANAETRKIGTLTLAERRAKIEKYLQKRKKRTWSRKINYDCRKRVADSRLRIKGRFVTRDQAFTLLEEANIPFNPETITNAEIKTLLTDKFGGSVLKKKSSEKQDTTICLKRPNEKELEEYELEDNDDFGSATSE